MHDRSIALAAAALLLSACSHRELPKPLEDAISVLGESEDALVEKVGRPDLEKMGPNAFDKQLYFHPAQLTVALQPRQRAIVREISTGCTDKPGAFAGTFDFAIAGVHRGDDIAALTKVWGPGEPATALDASLGNLYVRYPKKFRTAAGKAVDVTVHYARDRRGIVSFNFSCYE